MIDATAGNGYDTVFLAGAVGAGGRVLAFDIQAEAIAAARMRVLAAGYEGRVEFIEASHGVLANHVEPGGAAAVMFNLGYFPGGDPAVITRTQETLRALEAARHSLRPGGVLTVVCYPGHTGGDEEAAAVLSWAESLDPACDEFACFRRVGTLRPAPFLVRVLRRGGDS